MIAASQAFATLTDPRAIRTIGGLFTIVATDLRRL